MNALNISTWADINYRPPSLPLECGGVIRFLYLNCHLHVSGMALDLLTIGILVSIVCIIAVSVTGVMTYMKLGELIMELRMAHRFEDEKREGR